MVRETLVRFGRALGDRFRRRRNSTQRPPRSFRRELPVLLAAALALTFLVQTFVAKPYEVPSRSMEPTLHGCPGCANDRVLVDRLGYAIADVEPGDVVVFRAPPAWRDSEYDDGSGNAVVHAVQDAGVLLGFTPPGEPDFVKRVVAVGGQAVGCCDERGRVVVDGRPLDEPYVADRQQAPFAPVSVPTGQLWVMGDNRSDSADSRVPGHGPVPQDAVIGRVRLILVPFGRFGWVE